MVFVANLKDTIKNDHYYNAEITEIRWMTKMDIDNKEKIIQHTKNLLLDNLILF